MKNIILMIAAVAAVFTSVHADDITFKPGRENLATYGKAFSKGDIKTSQNKEALQFEIKADPAPPSHSRVVQIYCQVYKLKPGDYTLTFDMKTGGDVLVIPVELVGKRTDDSWFKLGQNYSTSVGAEWTTVTIPIAIEEKVPHGYVKLALGNLPNGSQIELKREFTFVQQ